jgi:hypothetical protein
MSHRGTLKRRRPNTANYSGLRRLTANEALNRMPKYRKVRCASIADSRSEPRRAKREPSRSRTIESDESFPRLGSNYFVTRICWERKKKRLEIALIKRAADVSPSAKCYKLIVSKQATRESKKLQPGLRWAAAIAADCACLNLRVMRN